MLYVITVSLTSAGGMAIEMHVIIMLILDLFNGQLCGVGCRTFLELFKRISSVSVRNQIVALQLLYSVCEPLLNFIYRLVYELIQGVFLIAALLTAEQTSSLLHTDQLCCQLCSAKSVDTRQSLSQPSYYCLVDVIMFCCTQVSNLVFYCVSRT